MSGMPAGVKSVVEAWTSGLAPPATCERVRDGFWYVRIPGNARGWIPVEIEVGVRTTLLVSHVIIEPDEREADVYRLLLRRNHRAGGVAFSLEGREGVICLVGRLDNDEVTESKLDDLVGAVVQETEETFRSILELGFARRLRKS